MVATEFLTCLAFGCSDVHRIEKLKSELTEPTNNS